MLEQLPLADSAVGEGVEQAGALKGNAFFEVHNSTTRTDVFGTTSELR